MNADNPPFLRDLMAVNPGIMENYAHEVATRRAFYRPALETTEAPREAVLPATHPEDIEDETSNVQAVADVLHGAA